jgi:UDP-GlcNAc:undecaprenyl-phosphate GlcNAc-1-phosphate transferase
MIILTTLLLSMFITIALIPFFRGLAVKVNVLDVPNKRKIHKYPMPKSGGLAMALGAFIPILLWSPADYFTRATIIGAGIVVLFGLLDDVKDLGFKTKFAGQFAAALIVIIYGGVKIKSLGMLLPDGVLLPDWLAIPLTLIVIVGITNAINLSDGLDGLAGGISLLSFLCIGYLAYSAGNFGIALLSAATVGAIFGFLRFNTYPATVFMGDAGSQLLGFMAIIFSLKLTQGNATLSPLLPLLLLGFPVLDTITVMFERVTNGKSPFVADKNHLHHKLMRLDLFHTEAVLSIYVLQAFLVTSAFVFRSRSEWFLLILYLVFSGVIISGFFIADTTGWKLKRFHFSVLKGRLKVLKEKNILIKVSFRIIEVGVPSLLVITCFLPSSVPRYFAFFSIGFLGLICIVLLFNKQWLDMALRFALYLTIPFVIYLSETDLAVWVSHKLVQPYNLSFVFLIVFVVLTLKFTRRTKGFKTSPMDFLILFIALVVPNLPDERIQSYHMGLVAAKIIVLFFSYEVLIGELREDLKRLMLATIPAVVIMAVRGLMG